MAKGGKMNKLKLVLKRMQSFSKLGRGNGNTIIPAANNSSDDNDEPSTCDKISRDLQTVYVGKSRRRYLVSSDVTDHPLFRELMERSGDNDDSITVGCEVVLFEHLLWMLENADPQPESLDELVEFYACRDLD
ncbi:unnamed protein product [Ilex paraguariensis]|uniref:Small auxin up regulated protein n=1 Tax=Ilex paraguariensis TaxID=185542 RepID=A0ABC8STM8_9AQUA